MSEPSDFEKAQWGEVVSVLAKALQHISGDTQDICDGLLRMEAPTDHVCEKWEFLVQMSQHLAGGDFEGARDILIHMEAPMGGGVEDARDMLRKAKRDDQAHLMIPEIGLKLLPFIVPKKLRDAVTGDLIEDFRTFATRWGRSYALRWLWWELAGLCICRFGPTTIVMGIGAWVRQKLGW